MSYTNGTAVLKMPSNYVCVKTEEMESICGGASNNTYQKEQQAKLRAELSKLTSAQRSALRKKAVSVQFSVTSFISAAIALGIPSSVANWIGMGLASGSFCATDF